MSEPIVVRILRGEAGRALGEADKQENCKFQS